MSSVDVVGRLEPELGWLERLCRKRAPSGQWEDLFQGAVAEYLDEAPRFLRQPTRRSPSAQVRHLLDYCVRRQLRRLLSGSDEESLEEREEHGTELAEPDDAPAHRLLVQRLAELDAAAAMTRIDEVSSPVRRFSLLATYRPELVDRGLLEEAAGVVTEGEPFLRRPLAEAWDLFESARSRPALVDDSKEWRRVLARIVRFDAPLEQVPRGPVLSEQVNVLYQNAKRACADLRKVLEGSAP